MFDPKSDYALNKLNPKAFAYTNATGTLTRITLEDFRLSRQKMSGIRVLLSAWPQLRKGTKIF